MLATTHHCLSDTFASTNVYYGSGFHNGSPNDQYPGDYLPQHTTFDLSVGKNIGERTTVSVNALNVANRRVLLDNSLTFGGFHYNDPAKSMARFAFASTTKQRKSRHGRRHPELPLEKAGIAACGPLMLGRVVQT